MRPPVCQFPAYTSARAFLLTTLPILLSEEHPVLLPLPGKVGYYPILHPKPPLLTLLQCVLSPRILDPTSLLSPRNFLASGSTQLSSFLIPPRISLLCDRKTLCHRHCLRFRTHCKDANDRETVSSYFPRHINALRA